MAKELLLFVFLFGLCGGAEDGRATLLCTVRGGGGLRAGFAMGGLLVRRDELLLGFL